METDNQTMFIAVGVIVVVLYLMCNRNEGFYFRSPPLSYDSDACNRMCDNTNGCNSSYYDPATRQCWMNSYENYNDLFYPHQNNTYNWNPSRFRFGKYRGYRHGHERPLTKRSVEQPK